MKKETHRLSNNTEHVNTKNAEIRLMMKSHFV